MSSRATLPLLLLALVLVLATGCSTAVVADTRLRSGRHVPAADVLAVEVGHSKHDVLAALGPPAGVLAPLGGDVFVYRMAQVDQFLLQFRSGLLGAGDMVLYADYDGALRDEAAYVFFDRDGLVHSVASRVSWLP